MRGFFEETNIVPDLAILPPSSIRIILVPPHPFSPPVDNQNLSSIFISKLQNGDSFLSPTPHPWSIYLVVGVASNLGGTHDDGKSRGERHVVNTGRG